MDSFAAPRREQGPSRSDPADPLPDDWEPDREGVHPAIVVDGPDSDAEAHQVFPASELRDIDEAVSRTPQVIRDAPYPPSPGPVDPQVYVQMGTGSHTWASSYMPKWNADWLVGRLRKLYPDATVEVIE